MAQLGFDGFEGAPNTPLLEHHPGWQEVQAATSIFTLNSAGTRARQASGGTGSASSTSFYRSDIVPPTPDYSVEVDLVSSGTTGSVGVTARTQPGVQTMYTLRIFIGTGLQLYRVVNGTSVLLGSNSSITVPNGETRRIKLHPVGNVINAYVDGELVLSPTDASPITAAGYAGIRAVNTSGGQLQIDNFTVSDEAVSAGGDASATSDGVVGSALVGGSAASGDAAAPTSAIAASALVGAASAIGATSAEAQPAGVTASASVGTATATAGTSIPADANVTMGIGAVAAVAATGSAKGTGGANVVASSTAAYAAVGVAKASTPGAATYPPPNLVAAGFAYGPNGDDFVGTYAGGGMTDAQDAMLTALAKIHGLIEGTPLVVTQTSRIAGDVKQAITEDRGVVTIARA